MPPADRAVRLQQPPAPRAPISRIPVVSDRLAWVGYDASSRRLECGLADGSVREYADVPASVHTGLVASRHADRFFEAHVEKAGLVAREVERAVWRRR